MFGPGSNNVSAGTKQILLVTMDFSQGLLGAGSPSYTSAPIASTPTPYLYASSAPRPTFAPSPLASMWAVLSGDNEEEMHQWSSLIGIVTALVGNVLISLALNIQRYAHIRINREYERDKLQKEDEWRQTGPSAGTSDTYGSIGGDGAQSHARGRPPPQRRQGRDRPEFEAYRDNVDEEDVSHNDGQTSGNLRDSFVSDRTARPESPDEQSDRKSYLRSPYWWVGIILMCLGETGNFMAYGFAPASIVSPLGVVALISNCIIAPCLLKEKFRGRDFWGVLISIAGAVVVVLSAKSSEEKLGPDEIWAMITKWEFELYLGLTTGLILALMWGSYVYGPRSILIDVGLVALFGKSITSNTRYSAYGTRANILHRWLHGFVYQRSLLIAVIYSMACHHLSHHILACFHPYFQCCDANSIHQSCAAAL